MPLTNFPQGLTSFGCPVLPTGPLAGIGGPGVSKTGVLAGSQGSQVFFVNSAAGNAKDAPSNGVTPDQPFKTLNYALTRTINNNGDLVFVGPQHVETVASAGALTFPTGTAAGVTVIFLGSGAYRGTINFTTATTATVTIPAPNVTIIGMRVLNSIDQLVQGLVVTGADCKLYNTEWYDATSVSSLIQVITSAAATRFVVDGYRYFEPSTIGTGGKTEAIRIVGGDRHVLRNIHIYGAFSTAVINNITTAMTNVAFDPNSCWLASSTSAVGPLALYTGSTLTLQGDKLSEARLSKSTLTSSSIGNTATTLVTASGEVYIENIVLKTDATGLATGTNFQLLSNDVKGLANIIVETVANLGANKTVDMFTASVTKQRTTIESGKAVQYNCTGSACTGTGTIDIIIEYRPLTPGAVLC